MKLKKSAHKWNEANEERKQFIFFCTGWATNPSVCRHTHTQTGTCAPTHVTPLTHTHTHPYHPFWHAMVPSLPYKSHSESRKLRLSHTPTFFLSSLSWELTNKCSLGAFLSSCPPTTSSRGPPSLIKQLVLTAINDCHLSLLYLQVCMFVFMFVHVRGGADGWGSRLATAYS